MVVTIKLYVRSFERFGTRVLLITSTYSRSNAHHRHQSLPSAASLPVSNASAFRRFSIAVGTSSNPSADTANLACFCASRRMAPCPPRSSPAGDARRRRRRGVANDVPKRVTSRASASPRARGRASPLLDERWSGSAGGAEGGVYAAGGGGGGIRRRRRLPRDLPRYSRRRPRRARPRLRFRHIRPLRFSGRERGLASRAHALSSPARHAAYLCFASVSSSGAFGN